MSACRPIIVRGHPSGTFIQIDGWIARSVHHAEFSEGGSDATEQHRNIVGIRAFDRNSGNHSFFSGTHDTAGREVPNLDIVMEVASGEDWRSRYYTGEKVRDQYFHF